MAVQKFKHMEDGHIVEAVLLLDSDVVGDKTWDDHVSELHDFISCDWVGEPEGIYLGKLGVFGSPGCWVVKHPDGVMGIFTDEELTDNYEEE